jgi:hypothetical protein
MFDKLLLVDLPVAIGVVIFEACHGECSVDLRQIAEFILGQDARVRFVGRREHLCCGRAPLIAGDDAVVVLVVAADPAKETLVDHGNIRGRRAGAGAACRKTCGGEAEDRLDGFAHRLYALSRIH